jgi:hypothetical protein
MSMMTGPELIEAAHEITGGNLKHVTVDKLRRLMTVTQYATDLCLNEIESRGALTYGRETGHVIVPYQSDHMLQTILTRDYGPHEPGQTQKVKGAWRSPEGPCERR